MTSAIAEATRIMEHLPIDEQIRILAVIKALIPKPVQATPRDRLFGCWNGKFHMSDDFDAPLEDFKEYME